MLVVSWNINSIRARLHVLVELIKKHNPDIICLQEIKCENHQFPHMIIHELGYTASVNGQKSYNGVAILSKFPIKEINHNIPRDEIKQSRYLEIITNKLLLINIYAPNGNPISDSAKFQYKLDWTKCLLERIKDLKQNDQILFMIVGDYNIAPKDEDCYNPQAFETDAVTQPEVRILWEEMKNQSMQDLLRSRYDKSEYTYWGYRGGCWQKGYGLRLDHMLISNQFEHLVKSIWVDKDIRAMDKSSDHAPVLCHLDLNNLK